MAWQDADSEDYKLIILKEIKEDEYDGGAGGESQECPGDTSVYAIATLAVLCFIMIGKR